MVHHLPEYNSHGHVTSSTHAALCVRIIMSHHLPIYIPELLCHIISESYVTSSPRVMSHHLPELCHIISQSYVTSSPRVMSHHLPELCHIISQSYVTSSPRVMSHHLPELCHIISQSYVTELCHIMSHHLPVQSYVTSSPSVMSHQLMSHSNHVTSSPSPYLPGSCHTIAQSYVTSPPSLDHVSIYVQYYCYSSHPVLKCAFKYPQSIFWQAMMPLPTIEQRGIGNVSHLIFNVLFKKLLILHTM